MKSEIPRRRLRRLLANSLIAGAGIMAVPPDADANTDDLDATDSLLDDDPGASDEAPVDIAVDLGVELRRMDPFDATAFATTAALAPEVRIRHLLAAALVSPFALVGDDVVLDHLSLDPDPDVRATAHRAAIARGLRRIDPAHGLRVLVIDDLASGRAALCASLSKLGCEVIGTSSRIAGRDVAWRDLVDVVVAQHQPPVTDGAKLVELVRDQAPELPAIVLRNPLGLDELARVIDALSLAREIG
jgi:CheY-like chemotaxis protein